MYILVAQRAIIGFELSLKVCNFQELMLFRKEVGIIDWSLVRKVDFCNLFILIFLNLSQIRHFFVIN